jgi:hypothetical protein
MDDISANGIIEITRSDIPGALVQIAGKRKPLTYAVRNSRR